MTALLAGFLIGMRHALDPDHLAALSVLVADRPSIARAAKQGVIWGLGHTLTLLLVGLIIIGFEFKLSAYFSIIAELAVGLMLVVLGIDLLRRWRKRQTAASLKRALGVGLMHGLAGSSALILLALTHLDSKPLALGYIGLFGLGSVLGMGLLSVALAWPLQIANRPNRNQAWVPGLTRGAACALSIGFGVALVGKSLATM